MRTITIITAAVGLLLGAAQADAKALRFNVSLYGVQRYTDTEVEKDVHPDNCFGAQGTTTSRSVVRFHTAKPVHVTAIRSGSYVQLIWPAGDVPIPVVADWEHSGDSDRAERSCLNLLDQGWQPDPPREATNCHKTLTTKGYSLTMSGGQVEVTGAQDSLVVPLDPFHGCPWGDMSLGLYRAKVHARAAIIMDGEESELTLRGREHSHTDTPDGSGSSDTVKQTTVYVVFKRR